MALTDLAQLKSKMSSPSQRYEIMKLITQSANTIGGSGWSSNWKGSGFPGAGATPTASVALDRTSVGAIPLQNASAGELRAWINRIKASTSNATTGITGMATMFVDRLNHQGGLDATVITAQTVSTAALTRSTSGVGVMIGLQIYTNLGQTGSTVTASYTNQAGVSGQVTQPVVFGTSSANVIANRVIPLSLAAGDTGAQSVQSVTVATTCGTAGNFGVVMYKPLTPIIAADFGNSNGYGGHPALDWGMYASLIPTDACVDMFTLLSGGSLSTATVVEMRMLED